MKYIDAEKLIAEVERRKQIHKSNVENGFPDEANKITEDDNILSLITSLHREQPECVEKTARISPGMLSNFGTSTFVLDVDLTQDETAKLAPFGFNSGKIKIKIVCE